MVRRTSIFGAIAAATLLVLATAHAALSDDLGTQTSAAPVMAAAPTAGCGKTPTLRSGTQSITT
ncbi:MAG: cellulose-binding protein, partial [Hamadaea sp.]|nr:cellulose-binding protein [Hamadaea sp.]